MLGAVVDTEVARFFSALAVCMGAATDLEEVFVAGMTEAATRVTSHPVLGSLLEREPELVLSQLAFARMDEVLAVTCAFTTPFLGRWLDQPESKRVAEWAARIVLSYLVCPADGVDLTDARHVRRLVRIFVLPGIRALRVPRGAASPPSSAVPFTHTHHQGGSIMTDQMRETVEIIGRDDINDLEAILSVVNTDVDEERHAVHSVYDTIFTWDYEKGQRPKLDKLYEKAKKTQWNGQTDLPWETEVDQEKLVVANAAANGGLGEGHRRQSGRRSRSWGDKEWIQFGVESQNWTLSQFMHGEQGALVCTAKIVESVPWIDAKYYAATQVMDEARHVEVFSKYLDDKLSGHYPINAHLRLLLDDIIADQRWDMTYLGMQIMVEGLALAAFGFMHQMTTEPLLKQLLRYVMSDEARHVAFGVLSLQEYYQQLSAAEIRERQEFAFEAAVRMRDRFLQQEVWVPHGRQPQGDRAPAHAGGRPPGLPVPAVLEDRAQLQEARPARRRRRLAPGQVHRARRDRVRGLGRHGRGVRHPAGHPGAGRGRLTPRPAADAPGPGGLA